MAAVAELGACRTEVRCEVQGIGLSAIMVRLLGNGLVSHILSLTVLLRCFGVPRETADWALLTAQRLHFPT